MFNISTFKNDIEFLKSLKTYCGSSKEYEWIRTAKKYYEGNNVTIDAVKKEIVVQQKKKDEHDKVTGVHYVKKNNVFVSNYKIANNYVSEMVDQKVFTLLDKAPKFEEVPTKVIDEIYNTLDFAIQKMCEEASISGRSYTYVDTGDDDNSLSFKTFRSENCVPFTDPKTEELKTLVRFFESAGFNDEGKEEFIEVFEENKYTLYQKTKDTEYTMISSGPYRKAIIGSAVEQKEVVKQWGNGIPIIMMLNNAQGRSDFNRSLRGQIDAIDIVMSDFANNLSDFQDIFWVIKGVDSSTEEIGSFMETIKNTYKASLPEGVDMDMKQVEIPHEAKLKFVERMEKQIIKNSGVMDTEMVLTGGLTQIAIKVASQRLMRRVSKFKYFVYDAVIKTLKFAVEFYGQDFNPKTSVIFFKSEVRNDAEIISNLIMSQGQISQQTFLEYHPYVSDVEEEIKRLDTDGVSKFSLNPPAPAVEE